MAYSLELKYDQPMAEKDKKLRTLDDIPVDGKPVLVRVDFNVSVGDDGKVNEDEDYRIEAALPTINELRQRRSKVILLTHVGRPQENGRSDNADLMAVHRRLEELLGEEVKHTKKLFGNEVETVVTSLEPGGVVLLPNVRDDAREEMGNDKFAHELAAVADVYVNECFSVSHRAHTSVAFVPHLLPSCAGRRTALEIEVLQRLRERPEHPYVAIASGAKISTKIGLLRDLITKVDTLCVAGQLANVFLAAQRHYPADRLSHDDIAAAQSLLATNEAKILLPVDIVIGSADGSNHQTVNVDAIPTDAEGSWDIGPKSVANILQACRTAKTILWNGPVGMFEVPAYATATYTLARELATLSAYRIVGGGDTVNAIERQHVKSKYDHISTGGGAMIEFMEGERMPGLEPLYGEL